MNAKARGARGRTRRLLEAAHYRVRFAAAMSPFDLVAIGDEDIRFVRLKCGKSSRLSSRDRAAMLAAPAP
jgi:hypothetical protein